MRLFSASLTNLVMPSLDFWFSGSWAWLPMDNGQEHAATWVLCQLLSPMLIIKWSTYSLPDQGELRWIFTFFLARGMNTFLTPWPCIMAPWAISGMAGLTPMLSTWFLCMGSRGWAIHSHDLKKKCCQETCCSQDRGDFGLWQTMGKNHTYDCSDKIIISMHIGAK